jgi:hypothetical protein
MLIFGSIAATGAASHMHLVLSRKMPGRATAGEGSAANGYTASWHARQQECPS